VKLQPNETEINDPFVVSAAGSQVQFSDFVAFLATVVVVTASGALMPGPLFAANLLQGARGGAKSGFMISLGHMLVELPLVMLIGIGISNLLNLTGFSTMVGLVGGSALVIFGALQIRDVTKGSFNVELVGNAEVQKKSLILGVGLTGLNPFFIVWWLTVGLGLVVQAVEFGALLGVFIMYVSHVWMDCAWLTGTACLAARGRTLLKARGIQASSCRVGRTPDLLWSRICCTCGIPNQHTALNCVN
jgi:threonine/homoserine/homoserine lactone efflux protein